MPFLFLPVPLPTMIKSTPKRRGSYSTKRRVNKPFYRLAHTRRRARHMCTPNPLKTRYTAFALSRAASILPDPSGAIVGASCAVCPRVRPWTVQTVCRFVEIYAGRHTRALGVRVRQTPISEHGQRFQVIPRCRGRCCARHAPRDCRASCAG